MSDREAKLQPAIPEGFQLVSDNVVKDAERYKWLREHSRDPDDNSGMPYCIRQIEFTDHSTEQHLIFEENLDIAIDQVLEAAKKEGV